MHQRPGPRHRCGVSIEKQLARAVQQKSRVWKVIPEAIGDAQFPNAARGALEQFRLLILKYRDRFLEDPKQMSRLFKELLAEIDYEAEVRKQYDEPAQQDQRMDSLSELTNALAQYESRAADPTLAGFLEDSALTGRDEEVDKDEQLSQRGIKLDDAALLAEFNRKPGRT